ncbi:MAG: carotenoid 1,2-hydratase, partial [Alphaproteobacteria bacterium]|nr:carotenoid 1,2-hydratase [Alphaproteobacteria bacterium]
MPFLSRRHLLLSPIALASTQAVTAQGTPQSTRNAELHLALQTNQHKAMEFPSDFGAHTDVQTEWWYVTGYAPSGDGSGTLGFQVTFFRSKVASTRESTSKLAAKHLLFAHAAVSDVAGKTLHSDQRIARWSGLPAGSNPADQAWARTQDTGLLLQDWSLTRQSDGRLRAQVQAKGFALDLSFTETQPLLLQGKG